MYIILLYRYRFLPIWSFYIEQLETLKNKIKSANVLHYTLTLRYIGLLHNRFTKYSL